LDAVSAGICSIAEIAFTRNSIEALVGSAWSAGTVDPKVSRVAVALTVLKIAVDPTILVAGACSANNRITSIASAAVRIDVQVAVEGADDGDDALSIVEGNTVVALAFAVDVGLVAGADRLAEAILFKEARFAETPITVTVIVVSRGTVSADSLDADVLSEADTSLGDVGVDLIDALARDDAALLFVWVVGFSRLAL